MATAPSAPPTIPSAAPALPDAAIVSPPPAPAAPQIAQPDSAPAAPTFTDAPPPATFSIRIPPLALLVPVGVVAALVLLAQRPSPEPAAPPRPAAQVEGAPTPEPEEPAVEPSSADAVTDEDPGGEPPVPPEVVAQKIAELERLRARAEQLDAARSRVKVTLYMNERCTRCVQAKSYLIAQGIFPLERDIDKDSKARARHRALTRKRGLPTIEVDGKVLVGFQPERLDKAIERAALARSKRKR